MYSKLLAFIVCLEVVRARDNGKGFRSLPAISNSLVNLGKMDITFHFNNKLPEVPPPIPIAEVKRDHFQPPSSFFFSKPDPVSEECPCSNVRNVKNPFMSNPSEMLSNILMSNDLFSYNKEPTSSTRCCDSHEHVQEDTVFFEFSPKQSHNNDINVQSNKAMPMLPFIFDNLLPNRPSLPTVPIKQKAIEILFFPKKKETTFDFSKISPKKKELTKKSDIQFVGDKQLKNDFKSYKFRPSPTIITSLGNKDLIPEENDKIDGKKTGTEPIEETTTITNISNSNAI